MITFGQGGGPVCDNLYQGPPGVLGGANAFVPARTGGVCVYGLDFNSDFTVELGAPDNSLTLGGSYFLSDPGQGLYWRNYNLADFGSHTGWLGDGQPILKLVDRAYTRVFLKIRWRGDLPAGPWNIRVITESGELSGDFSAVAPEHPAVTVVDSRLDWILPAYSNCHFADEPDDLFAMGEGYSPRGEVYLYVYEKQEGLVLDSVVKADPGGGFYTRIAGPYHPGGEYFLIASQEPLEGGEIPYGNQTDCFYVP
jgi:hypothetical protein